jgi:hypothetical protein
MSDIWNGLTPLDPQRDPSRWEALLERTREAANDELARRRTGVAWPVTPIARWLRPALSLAAALVVAAAGLLALAGRGEVQATPGVPEAMGMPVAMSGMVENGSRAEALLLPSGEEP